MQRVVVLGPCSTGAAAALAVCAKSVHRMVPCGANNNPESIESVACMCMVAALKRYMHLVVMAPCRPCCCCCCSCRDASACDVPLDHPSASRQHAALCHHNDGRIFLIDLGSTHGTFLDGSQMPANKPVVLKNGTKIKFGQMDAKFVMRDVESAGGAAGKQELCKPQHGTRVVAGQTAESTGSNSPRGVTGRVAAGLQVHSQVSRCRGGPQTQELCLHESMCLPVQRSWGLQGPITVHHQLLGMLKQSLLSPNPSVVQQPLLRPHAGKLPLACCPPSVCSLKVLSRNVGQPVTGSLGIQKRSEQSCACDQTSCCKWKHTPHHTVNLGSIPVAVPGCLHVLQERSGAVTPQRGVQRSAAAAAAFPARTPCVPATCWSSTGNQEIHPAGRWAAVALG